MTILFWVHNLRGLSVDSRDTSSGSRRHLRPPRDFKVQEVLGATLWDGTIPAHEPGGNGPLGWDSCDIILVTGDAYVDHPSFGMAVIGRTLEAQGFRVGIIAQPEWNDAEAFKALGEPNIYFGVTAGNMDSLVNNYTADKKKRSDDNYTPHGVAGQRPDRAVRYIHNDAVKRTKTSQSLLVASKPVFGALRILTIEQQGTALSFD